MTSAERHEARYQRRKAARTQKREQKIKDALQFDTVFTYIHLYRSALMCFKNVRWKASVQAFKSRCGIAVARRLRQLKNRLFKLRGCPEFTTRERGHERRINSIHIEDRVPQKCMCKYSLKPVLHRSVVYDNYSSQEGKGTDKARKRLKCMLERHIRRYGMTGGMIIFDFKGFFDSIRHSLVLSVLEHNYEDEMIIWMNMKIVKQARKDIGLILGSENSQDFAISTPSAIDHFIKEILRVESSGRYNDDGWIIDPDYDYLEEVYGNLKAISESMGFRLNDKKSRIIKFGKPFSMLKRKYIFTDKGEIIIRPERGSVIRERRKLKRLYHRYLEGTVEYNTGLNSLNAWRSSLRGCKCWKIKNSLGKLYNRLYIENWLNGEEVRKPCTTRSYPKDKLSMPQPT